MKAYLRLLKYLAPYKGMIVFTWVLSVLVVLSQGITVWVGAGFVQKVVSNETLETPRSVTGLASFLDGIAGAVLERPTPFGSLIAGVLVLVAAATATAAFRVLKLFLFARINQRILTRIRLQMFSRLTQLSLAFSRKYRAGEVASLLLTDVGQLRLAIIDGVDRIFLQPLRLIVALGLMFTLSIELTLWVGTLLILSSATVHYTGDRMERVSERLMKKIATLQGHLTEYLSVVVLARSLGREKKEKERFGEACRSLARTDVEADVTAVLAPQIVTVLFVVSGGVLLLLGGYRVLVSGTLEGSVLIKMTFLLPMVTYPLQALASLYLSVRTSVASAKRVFKLIDEVPSWTDLPDARDAPQLRDCIAFEDLSYEVDGKVILDRLSFEIPRGKKVLFFGPSGAGKTTILGLIAGFLHCTSGAVRVDGVDLRSYRSASWARRLGIVAQEPLLLNGTVRENLLYACEEADDRRLERVLREALLWDGKCVFADGLDTQVGNWGQLVSGGERQRLTIARALLTEPSILLLDEPTSMLDADSGASMRETILAVSSGRTLIVVTHDPALRDIADIEFEIAGGQLVATRSRDTRRDLSTSPDGTPLAVVASRQEAVEDPQP